MAVAFFYEAPGIDPAVAQQASDRINQRIGNQAPAGGLYHAEGPLDGGGWWGIDVWDSEESAQRFYREVLEPIVQELGVSAPQPRKLSVQWESSQAAGG